MSPRQKHKPRSHATSAKASKRPFPGWLLFVLGVIVGGFAVILLRPVNTETTRQAYSAPPANTPSTRKSDGITTPVFEFYDRLKQEQVDVPNYIPAEQRAAAAQTHEYFLQVASFRKKGDADKLRASLILMNMEANIESSHLQSGDKRYRVIVGPYRSKSKLAKAQQTLVSNNYEFLKLKRAIQK